LIALSHSWCNK